MDTVFRSVCVFIFVSLLALSPAALFGQVFSEPRPVVLHSADDTLREIEVWHVAPLTSRFRINFSDRRYDVPDNRVELVNLDPTWKIIRTWAGEETKDVFRDKMPPAPPAGLRDRFWLLRHWVLSILFAVLGFYAVFTIGLEGGPAGGGVLPFGLNLFHLAGFLWFARGWAGGYFHSYLVILMGALILSVFAMGAMEKTLRIRVIRGVMIGCYIAMFLVINIKTYESTAFWSARDVMQVYVPKNDRNRIEALGDRGEVVAGFTLTKGIDCRTVLFWHGNARPGSLRIIPASGNPYVVPVRPGAPRPLL